MFTFKIDNTTVTDPLEWAEFTETLEYDQQFNGILMKYNQKFTFTNDGYDLISNYLTTNGYCNRLPLQVWYQCGSEIPTIVLDGFIFLTEAKFNRSKCTVEVEFEDNSYTSKIFGNRNIKTYVNAEESKNGVAITPATELIVFFFDPYQVIQPFTRTGYDVKDVFRFLIDFMTDGTVGFVSDWYDNLPQSERVLLCSGTTLRYTAPRRIPPNVSFQELFIEMHKKFNLVFAVEKDANGNPRIRIENYDYFKNTATQTVSITDIPELIESFDSDKFYAQVNIGSTTMPLPNLLGTQFALFPYPFVTFQKEEYYIQGECNTDEELDLVSSYVIDSNIIQGLTTSDTANTDYDNMNVFVQYDYLTNQADYWNDVDAPVFSPQRIYYNKIFTNVEVAARFNVQGQLAKNLGPGTPVFRASKTIAEPSVTKVGSAILTQFGDTYIDLAYQDDSTPPNQDPGNDYSTVTYRYTAPQTALYTFEASYETNTTVNTQVGTNPQNNYWYIGIQQILFRKYDTSGTLVQIVNGRYDVLFPGFAPKVGVRPITGGNSIFLLAGESVAVQASVTGYYKTGFPAVYGGTMTYNIQNGFFRLIAGSYGGGIIGQTKDPNNYFTSIYEFEQVLSEAEWTAIVNNPQNFMRFSMTSNPGQKGWLRKIERNKATGLTKFTLTSNFNNA